MNEKLRCELAKKKISDNPSYQGIPIKTTELIEKGNIIVCDKPFFFTN